MPTILVIDDSRMARQEVIEILRQNSPSTSYYEAADGIEGLKIALNKSTDLIICDVEMPGMDGFKFLRMLSSREELQDIPVIMVTGREDSEAKIRSLEQGASDYVTKPYDSGELLARVKVQLKIKSLQDKLKQSNQMLLELSHTDPLTGLNNRRSMMEALDKEFERSTRKHSPLSLLMLDIDHFKKVNDTFGHQQGDAVLQALATLLKEHLRQYDLAARFGGEEFALILPETDEKDAGMVAERIRQSIEKMRLGDFPAEFCLTASIGVATSPNEVLAYPDDLIREADNALYQAKRSGRNRIEQMKKKTSS
jgi:two-component system, cell cycle response regulator